MIKVGIIGHPIGHSKSPLIHSEWIKRYGLSGSYEAFDVAPDMLAQRLSTMMREEGYTGFNLTVPHKEHALELCCSVDRIARDVGAVNTVFMRDDKIYGTNTDVYGFVQNIKGTRVDFDFSEGTAVVLGAGGAARAAVYGLLQEGAPKIIITNRTRAKAESIAEMDSRIEVADWDDRNAILKMAHFLVNTTVLGMAGQRPLDIDLRELPMEAVVCDIVYAPIKTPLLAQAQKRGNRTVSGIGMLLYQAAPAFQSWFGILPSVDQALVKKVLGL